MKSPLFIAFTLSIILVSCAADDSVSSGDVMGVDPQEERLDSEEMIEGGRCRAKFHPCHYNKY